jgi:hypothetical protein
VCVCVCVADIATTGFAAEVVYQPLSF